MNIVKDRPSSTQHAAMAEKTAYSKHSKAIKKGDNTSRREGSAAKQSQLYQQEKKNGMERATMNTRVEIRAEGERKRETTIAALSISTKQRSSG